MITGQRIAKALTLIAAALLLNVMACNKASFEATDPTNRPAFPDANGVTENGEQNDDGGDAINCGNPNSIFCANNDDGFQDNVPPMVDPPFCDIKRPTVNNCYENIYRNSTKDGIAGINLWLVVDSSRSFDAARMAVARQVSQAFLTSLRHQVPVTISVIPAHAPSSSYGSASSFNGRIYGQVTIRPGENPTSAMNQLLSFVDSSMQESPISLAKRDRRVLDNLNYANGVSGPVYGGPNSGSDEMGLDSFM
ncbi:MAG: hypothetical protein MJK18_11785, partial [Bdellovibrionales bacterium]|nr:hypothetical protein [Bdellovibrionales bacterium]